MVESSKKIAFALFLGLWLCSCSQPQELSADVIQPDQVEAMVSDEFSHPPPDESTAWYKVSLPDNWNRSRPNQGGGVWYRIPIRLAQDGTQPLAVLLANFSMNAAIWWDGHMIESGGQITEPVARNWHRPLYAGIGVTQQRQGQHWLHIYVRGYANDASGLGAIYIGSETIILPMYGDVLFTQQTLSMMALFGTLLLAVGALMMWGFRPSQKAFFWIAIASFFWSSTISNFVIINPPVPRFFWESISQGAVEFYVLSLLIMTLHILGMHKPVLVRSLAFLITAGWAVVLLFGDNADVMPWSMPLHTLAVLMSLYMCWICGACWYQQRQRIALVMGVSFAIQLLFGAHDWWVIYFGNQLEDVLIMQFGPTLALLLVGAWLIYSFAQSLKEADAYTSRIEAEVTRISSKLEEEQRQKTALMKQQLISNERERFTRELHDGLGGYLSAMSSMLHDGVKDEAVLSDTVDKALLDMRLVMDGVGEDCRDVGMILGMLKHRLASQLQAWKLSVSWNMSGMPMQCELAEGQSLHLMRIVQEALTNAARHAQADWVEVRASLMQGADQPVICIQVIDNGCGWIELPESGNGLSNMRKRADMMGATLNIVSAPNAGGCISLMVPVSIA